ncbi:unnamed protein product, partial [Musa hybrid cultivar]
MDLIWMKRFSRLFIYFQEEEFLRVCSEKRTSKAQCQPANSSTSPFVLFSPKPRRFGTSPTCATLVAPRRSGGTQSMQRLPSDQTLLSENSVALSSDISYPL